MKALIIVLTVVFLDTELENAGHHNALVVKVSYATTTAKLVILSNIAMLLEEEILVRLV